MASTGQSFENIEAALSLLNMLSNKSRLQILCTLSERECSVLELAKSSGLSQPAMSQHLKKLRHADLVQTRRSAQSIFYTLKGKETKAILKTLHDLYCSPAALKKQDKPLVEETV